MFFSSEKRQAHQKLRTSAEHSCQSVNEDMPLPRIHQGFCVLTQAPGVGHTDPLSSGRTAGTKPGLAAISGGNTDKPTNSRPTPARLSRSVAGHQDLGIKLLPASLPIITYYCPLPPVIGCSLLPKWLVVCGVYQPRRMSYVVCRSCRSFPSRKPEVGSR